MTIGPTPLPITPLTVAHDSGIPIPLVQRHDLSQDYMIEEDPNGEFVRYSDYLTLYVTYWNLLIATGNVAIAAVAGQSDIPESGVKNGLYE